MSAECDGFPASEIVMTCGVGAGERSDMRWTKAEALWDTGTSTTIITPEVASRLGLKPGNGVMGLSGMGGTDMAWTALVSIGLPCGLAWGPMRVAVHELPTHDVLLGMDIISIGKFTIERKPDGGTRFTFDLNI